LDLAPSVIERGYKYLMNNFMVSHCFLFKRFLIKNKPSLISFDLYDNAEMLNLATLLNDEGTVQNLNEAIGEKFIKDNAIYSTIDIFGFKKNAGHLRWAIVPYILAISISGRIN
jgi:hypothetical protein